MNAKVEELEYLGSAIPRVFGSLRNTFSYKGLELSASIFYKFKYFVKRQGINYTSLIQGEIGHAEYSQRWMKPGDEQITNVPSFIWPENPQRDQFYTNSSIMIDKGDHIRLQDITLSYSLPNYQNLRFYANMTNIGILWKSSSKIIDPGIIDGYPQPKIYGIGVSANF